MTTFTKRCTHRKRSLPQHVGQRPAVDNMRIAQEYEAAFGRSDLHDVLRQLVPDHGYGPGDEHRRLLQLPWRDIFTTNWDTLLERSAAHVPERNYSVVTSIEEIPMASRPRVVKLHGSFAAQFPLIVTEEDYRTYPMKFAPFVNTVQQAMMETVFLLIGFSGDDPNFLNWSGWVRDNLGASAPKIYLAGWLGPFAPPPAYVGESQRRTDRPRATSAGQRLARQPAPQLRNGVVVTYAGRRAPVRHHQLAHAVKSP